MKLSGKCRAWFAFTLILVIIILLMPFEDYIERTLDYEYIEWDEVFYGEIGTSGGVVNVPSGLGEVTLKSSSCSFPAGTYTVIFYVDAYNEDVTVDVYDSNYLNADNTSGRILSEEIIPAGDTSVNLSFSIEEEMTEVVFRIRSSDSMIFRGIYILSESGIYKDPYIYAALVLLGSAVLCAVRVKKRVRTDVLILLSFAAVWATLPMCYSGLLYVEGQDLPYHFARLYCLSEDLFSGQLPVMIHSSMYGGFGYLMPSLYPELFLVPFAVLIHLGLSPIGGYRLLILSINIATAGVGYYSFSRIFKSRKTGLIAAFFYMLSSYRLADLYTRSAIGEALASVFLPLLMLGIIQIFYGNYRKWLTAAIAFTAVFQSHLISTELALAFCVLAGLAGMRRLVKERHRLYALIKAAAVTVLLNLWSLLPMLDLMGYPLSAFTDVRVLEGYSAYAFQLLDTTIGNAAGTALPLSQVSGEMPYSVGMILILGSLGFLVICLKKKHAVPGSLRKLGTACLMLGALSMYASSNYFPWAALQRISVINSLVGRIQFAFRFLMFATLFLCVPAALGVYYMFKDAQMKRLLVTVCFGALVYISGQYFSEYTNEASVYVNWEDQSDVTREADTLYLITDDYEYFSKNAISSQESSFDASEGVELMEVSRDGSSAVFSYVITDASDEAFVDVSLFYCPYYTACDEDGNELETSISGELLRLRIYLAEEKTQGTVTVSFVIPKAFRAAELISSLTAVFIVISLTKECRRRKKNKLACRARSVIA